MFEPLFPETIDSTMVKAYKSCPRSFFHAHVEGRRLKEASIDLLAGGALAAGMEEVRSQLYAHGHDLAKALSAGESVLAIHYGPDRPGEKKSLSRVLAAFRAYWTKWGPGSAEEMAPIEGGIEKRFSIPVAVGDKVINYSGRMDALCIEQGSMDPFTGKADNTLWVVDEKTCSSMWSDWHSKYSLDCQMLGYAYAARQLGFPVEGVVIRAINLGRKEFDPKQDLLQTKIRYSDKVLEDWYADLGVTLEAMWGTFGSQSRFKGGSHKAYSQAFGNACTQYRGCSYRNLCLRMPAEPEWEEVRWNPLAEIKIEA